MVLRSMLRAASKLLDTVREFQTLSFPVVSWGHLIPRQTLVQVHLVPRTRPHVLFESCLWDVVWVHELVRRRKMFWQRSWSTYQLTSLSNVGAISHRSKFNHGD